MKSFKSITVFVILLLLFSACTRKSYPVEKPTETLHPPNISQGNPMVNETVPKPVTEENNSQATAKDWESLYTEYNPVTDPQELIRILQDLKGRFLNQFDKPGWYQLEMLGETYWIHVSVPGSERFDSVLSYIENEKYSEGFLNPNSFFSLDGHYGRMRSPTLDDFFFVHLETESPEAIWENLDYYLACDFCVASEHIDFLTQWIRDPDKHISEKSLKETFFSGWTGTYEGQPVFILNINVKFLTNYPVTGTGEQVEIEDNFYYISLANGGTIDENTDWFYLSGNKDLDSLTPYNLHKIAYFETLPEHVQTLYDECYKKLTEFEGQN